MATEVLTIDGTRVTTLRELIGPGPKAIFIGINPSPVSVAAGHYYQGTLGQRFWQRLQQYKITEPLTRGREDDAAYAQGFGFADLVRRPTTRATALTKSELTRAVPDLVARIAPARGALAVFVFAKARDVANAELVGSKWTTFTMPGPYASTTEVMRTMNALRETLSEFERAT